LKIKAIAVSDDYKVVELSKVSIKDSGRGFSIPYP